MRKVTSRSVLVSATALALSAVGWSAWCGSAARAQPGVPAAPAPASAGTGAIRIAIANPAHIFNDMAETKSLQIQMGEEQKKFQAAELDKRTAINDMKAKRDALNPDHPQWAELNGQLASMAAEYKVWVETQKANAENMQKQKMKVLFRKIEDAVGEVAKRDGVDLVIADNRDPLPTNLDDIDVRTWRGMILQRDVLYSGDRADLSQAVLTLLDARFRAAAGGAAPAPVPAGSALSGGPSGPYAPR